MASFIRAYELILQPDNGLATILFQDRSNRGLGIDFEIEKTSDSASNTATIKIYNPNEETIASIGRGDSIQLSAGYHDDISVIAVGTVTETFASVDGTDTLIEINMLEHLTDTSMNETVYGFPTNIQLIDKIVSFIKANVKTASSANVYFIDQIKNYNWSVILYGNPFVLLTEYLSIIDYGYYVSNGVLTIYKIGFALKDSSILINSTNGMIGSPKKITKKDGKTSSQGIEVRSLLNFNLVPGRMVTIESREVSGTHTIDSVNFKGNSVQGDWFCDVRIF